MKTENFDNDEPIHHFEGNDLMHSCPSEPPSALLGASSSPNTHSPHATISPPVKQSLHKLLGLLKWLSIFRPSNHTSPSIINYFIIENRTIENNNNLSYNNAMKIIGPIVNYGTIQENNFYGKNEQQSNEKEGKEDVEDADHTEVVEVQPVPVDSTKVSKPRKTRKKSQLTFIDCIAERETAHILLKWLHQMMDNKDKPKQKLIYLRAISEAGYFSQTPDHDVYVKEFGKMARSSYYDWMQAELKYDLAEINKLIEQYSLFLAQFPK